MFFLRLVFMPAIVALMASGIALGWQRYSGFSDTIAIIVGCAVFCALMVLLLYSQQMWQTRQTDRKLSAVFGLEDNLLRRIHDIEAGQNNALTVEDLQQRLAGLEAIVQTRDQHTIQAAINTALDQTDGNVVVLKPKTSTISGKGRTGNSRSANARQIHRSEIATLLAEGNLSIKLQPVANLMNREVVAVEAFAFLETGSGPQPVTDTIALMNEEQLCLIDQFTVKRLSSIVRKMETDGQLVPVHYSFVSMTVGNHPTWQKICNMLKADPKLAMNLVPQMNMAQFKRLGEQQLTRFLEFREFGSKPCLTQCKGVRNIVQLASQHRLSLLKLPISELLGYTDRDGERMANTLLPQLDRLGVEIIATHVEKAHQAANLIDLDLILAQGDFISPARSIKDSDSYRPLPAADISG